MSRQQRPDARGSYRSETSGTSWESQTSESQSHTKSTNGYDYYDYYDYSSDGYDTDFPGVEVPVSNQSDDYSYSQDSVADYSSNPSDDSSEYDGDDFYPGIEVDNSLDVSQRKVINLPTRKDISAEQRNIVIPRRDSFAKGRANSTDSLSTVLKASLPQKRVLPLSITIPTRNMGPPQRESSQTPIQEEMAKKPKRVLKPSASFDQDVHIAAARPIILNEIPKLDDIVIDQKHNEIDPSLLIQMELTEIQDLLKNPVVGAPTKKEQNESRHKHDKLNMSKPNRFEKTIGTEILEDNSNQTTRRHRRENVRTALSLPKQTMPRKSPEVQSRENSLSRPGLSVDLSMKSTLQISSQSKSRSQMFSIHKRNSQSKEDESYEYEDESKENVKESRSVNSFTLPDKGNKLQIQLPGSSQAAELKWVKPKKHKPHKFKGVLFTSLSVQKDGLENPDLFTNEEENEYYEDDDEFPSRYGDPVVEKPARLDDTYMQEMMEVGEDGVERKQKFIMIPRTTQKQEPLPNIIVDRADKYTAKQVIVKKNLYTEDQLRNIRTELIKINKLYPIPKRSKGLAFLENLVYEMHHPDEFKSRQFKPTQIKKDVRKQAPEQTKEEQKEPERSPDRFIPSSISKSIGKMDENSDEMFKFQIKQLYNRLTLQTIMKINDEIVPLFINDARVTFAVDQFCMKAANERSFAPIYANFTSKCTSTLFREKVVRESIARFFDAIANPGKAENENDVSRANGTAAFFAALLKETAVAESNGHVAVTQLFEALEKEPLHSTIIEMLHTFIVSAGSVFVMKIESKLWEKLDSIIEKKSIKPRLQFLLIEVVEAKKKYTLMQEKIQPKPTPAPTPSPVPAPTSTSTSSHSQSRASNKEKKRGKKNKR